MKILRGEVDETRTKLQHLWCQHCKALQKSSGCEVRCWYNPLDAEEHFAFCAANHDAVEVILAQMVDVDLSKMARDWLLNDIHSRVTPFEEYLKKQLEVKHDTTES